MTTRPLPLTMVLDHAKAILATGEDLHPILMIESAEKVAIVDLAYAWSDRQAMRRAVLQEVGSTIGREMQARRALLIVDAWTVKASRLEDLDKRVRPSEDPRRVEALIVSELLPNGHGESLHCEYTRLADGKFQFAEPHPLNERIDYTFDAFFDGVRGVTDKGDA